MPTILWKNFLKCLPSTPPICIQHPFPLEQDDHQPSPPSTTTNTTTTTPPPPIASYSKTTSLAPSTDSSDTCSPVDFAAILASQRFFFSSPGNSNSIIDSSEPHLPSPNSPLTGGLAVKKYSPDPYQEFKRSMQEMIEARKLNHVRVDWEYLHELLSCYLSLNSKHTHKFIITAFSDIVISLLSSSSPESDNLCPEH